MTAHRYADTAGKVIAVFINSNLFPIDQKKIILIYFRRISKIYNANVLNQLILVT